MSTPTAPTSSITIAQVNPNDAQPPPPPTQLLRATQADKPGSKGPMKQYRSKSRKLEHKPSMFEGLTASAANSTRGTAMLHIIKKHFPKPKESLTSGSDSQLVSRPADAYPPLYPQLRDAYNRVTPEFVSQDLHRLIYRVTVKSSGQKDVLLAPPAKDQRNGVKGLAEAEIKLIKLLNRRVEVEDHRAEIEDICDDKLSLVTEKTDMLRFNLDLFTAIGEDSRILKVLRCIHQSLILTPYGILRTQLLKKIMTKDVRGEDGWQIVITTASEGFIQVVHRRREQSMDKASKNQPDKAKNHWEFDWEVSMTFDKEMIDMTQTRLSITKLTLNSEMDPELESELRTVMKDGDLIVY